MRKFSKKSFGVAALAVFIFLPISSMCAAQEKASPETSAFIEKIADIIKGGDLRDPGYVETLFNVKFSEPFFNDVPPQSNDPHMGCGAIGCIDISRRVQNDQYALFYHVRVPRQVGSPTLPYTNAYNASLQIEISDRLHICVNDSDFQGFFSAPSKWVPGLDPSASSFTKEYGSKSVTLNLSQESNNCRTFVTIGTAYSPLSKSK